MTPVCLFVYNRLDTLIQTIRALKGNHLANETDLIIFSDGGKNEEDILLVNEVRGYLKTISGFRSVSIIANKENIGLSESIIKGVTEIIKRYGKVIVLEDDMITSPGFLSYMNDALDFYENTEDVISIHGYIYPTKKKLPETFFLKGADCWGWATWERGWNLFEPNAEKLFNELQEKHLEKEFDFDKTFNYTGMLKNFIKGKNNSWAIRWYASAFLKNKLTLYPGKTLITNIGLIKGTHCKNQDSFLNEDRALKINVTDIPIVESSKGKKAFKKFFKSLRPTLLQRLINKLI